MQVLVKVFSTLEGLIKNYPGKEGMEITLPEAATAQTLLSALSIPREEIGLLLVNGTYAEMDTVLHNDDEVNLFPHIEGG